ncbi:translation initiation factor IF-2 [Calothrix sp. PCC 6303]|uniref:translation initiation factor IF-2 n=1 Tax=Calothrix sp. PCC 6303 TaxID=1170562 RepID=UPI0002A02423|nr:translation initiation factor IF-2 [Calothrix sp. PCC 6303]AFY99158.1 translation initiation factor IF-2 [Calothrix sp. PCC 6303]
MTNGKVRIYELSKELNLDNKELLAICDQLNIAVKSHSSTITESEAERIRSQAEKQAVTNVSSRQESGSSQKQNLQQAGSRNRPPVANKQQIIEIRKPKLLSNSSTNGADASGTNANQFSSSEANSLNPPPPRPLAPEVSSMKPSAPPTRPVPRNQSETASEPVSVNVDKNPARSQQVEKTVGEKTEKVPRPRPDKTPKPQLVAPPTRPAEPDSSTSTNIGNVANVASDAAPTEKPVLRREKSSNEGREEREHVVKPKVNRGGSEMPQSPSSKPSRPSAPVRSDQKPSRPSSGDNQRPSRPLRSGESPVSAIATPPRPMPPGTSRNIPGAAANDDDRSDIPTDVIELKRPTPPRLAKAGAKKWQEEEIDEKEKLGKLAPKGKRVKPIVEDDFDDDDLLDDEDAESLAALQVSNAIVRPPKPKSATKASQPIAAVTTQAVRTRKAAAASNKEQNQNRRREPEQKRDRPEKIVVYGPMTVQELADVLVVADTEIVRILFIKGMAVSITQNLDISTIQLIATELEVEVEVLEPVSEAIKNEMLELDDLDNLQRRPPVVTIMGHVDHGKTTLLDSIRKTKVAAGEAGGITQHIGAYHVDVEHNGKEQQVVFLDTPGHEAFTAMRARGARVTDIAILVVAADDGVRPQTIEAIRHAQAAEVPIIVAINKVDKEAAQPDRVKQELTQYNLTPEEWGGDTIMVPVSAIKGENLDTLLEMILLVAEIGELSANPNRPAKGTVIEAHLDKAKGAVATLLIQNGTLRVGDILVAGSVFGKVRAMVNDRSERVDIASPSFAVEVLGLSDVPAAGDEFSVFLVEKEARAIASQRADKIRQSRLMQGRVTLTSISAQAQEGELKELNLILKGDVQGSVEAIVGALKQIPQNEVQIRMLLSSAGEITETDIDLASASGAVIIGFNTTLASGARQAADEAGVDVREYNIIYKLLEDIQAALEGLLEPELVEEPLGTTEVRAVFPVGRGAVAGCYVQNGKLVRNCKVRVQRNGKVIYEGVLDSLKRMREDSREVNAGYECGVGIDKFNDWVEGDIIESYQLVTKRRTLTMTR